MQRACLILLFLVSAGLPFCRAELTPSQRLKAVRAMVPVDPMHRLVSEVPTFEPMTNVDLETVYRKKKADPFRVRTLWFEIGMNFFLRKDYENALVCVEQSYVNNELTRRPYGFQALLLQLQGDWKKSNALWSEVLDLRTQDPDALMGSIAYKLNTFKFVAAEESINRLLESDIDPVVKLHYSGLKYYVRSDYLEAHHYFLKAVKHKDALPESAIGLAVINLHEDQVHSGIGWLRRACELAMEYDRIRFVNLPVFDGIKDHPGFQKLLNDFKLTRYVGAIPPDVFASIDTTWTAKYRQRCEQPTNYKFKIQLKAFEAKD